jgi:hypothetical protein
MWWDYALEVMFDGAEQLTVNVGSLNVRVLQEVLYPSLSLMEILVLQRSREDVVSESKLKPCHK